LARVGLERGVDRVDQRQPQLDGTVQACRIDRHLGRPHCGG
jgi:hypothetical protein